MLNQPEHPINNNVKPYLTSIKKTNRTEVWLVFKEGAFETIKTAKGWKSDNQMAQALGFTR